MTKRKFEKNEFNQSGKVTNNESKEHHDASDSSAKIAKLDDIRLEAVQNELRELTLIIKNTSSPSNEVMRDIRYAIIDLDTYLQDDFDDWVVAKKKVDPQKLNRYVSFISHNCGQLAPYADEYVPAYIFHTLLDWLNEQPVLEAGDIMRCIYGMFPVIKAGNLRGKMRASSIEPLLNKLLSLKTQTIDISNCLQTIGLLAQMKLLTGEFNASLMQQLLEQITLKDPPAHGIGISLYSLGLLAEKKQMVGFIDSVFIQHFLEMLFISNTLDAQNTFRTFLGVGLLAESAKLQGGIDAAIIHKLLYKILDLKVATPANINIFLLCIERLSKAGNLRGSINASLIHELLKRQIELNALDDLSTISQVVGSLGALANEGKLEGTIDANLMQILLDLIPQFNEVSASKISEIFLGLGLLVKAKKIDIKQITTLKTHLNYLMEKLFTQNINAQTAEQTLSGIIELVPLVQLDAEHLDQLLQCVISNKGYIHPQDVVKYLNYFTQYNHDYLQLDNTFKTLLPSITFPLNYLSTGDKALILKNISVLERNTQSNWASLLKEKFGIKEPETVQVQQIVPRASNRQGRDASISIAPQVRVRPTPTTREEQRPLSWRRAYSQDPLFKAIADQDIHQLEQLLQIHVKLERGSRGHTSSNSNASTPSQHSNTTSSTHDIADDLVTSFLQNTESQALQQLIKHSNASYFELLLRACSHHVRYQLAIANSLHPINLYLPIKELQYHIAHLQNLELYRDSNALLKIIDALKIRALEHPEHHVEILELQNQLLDRAFDFHQKTKHRNVIGLIRTVKSNLNPKTTAPVSLQVPPVIQTENSTLGRTNATHSSHGLFAPVSPIVNTSYEYEPNEVHTILKLRLKSCNIPGLVVLNVATNEHKIKDILQQYLAERELQANELNIVIPVFSNNSWYGIRLQWNKDKAPRITYYSCCKDNEDEEDQKQINALLVVNIALGAAQLKEKPVLSKYNTCLESREKPNDAVFLIENIYCDLEKRNWQITDPGLLTKAIRQRHLKLLQNEDLRSYNKFIEHQTIGETTNSKHMEM